MAKYTLGLDIGSKSIGWALLDIEGNHRIENIGVRVFPEGVDRDTKGAEISKNEKRREARGARRIKFRNHLRKNRLKNLLRRSGLLPEEPSQLDGLMLKEDPYHLRAIGLKEKLALYEFGRALYHINQRRGFKSNRKSGDGKDDGVVKKQAGQLQNDIDVAGCKTLGQYLASLDPEQQRRRERYTFRSMYESEFDQLWEKQAVFYPDILTEDLQVKVKDETIFFQRPLKPSDHLIGKCELEEGEKRCPKADWYARKFRLIQDINNLKICSSDGTEQRLDDTQRESLFEELSKYKELPFDNIRKLEVFGQDGDRMVFNLEQDGKVKNLKGDAFNSAMSKVFDAKRWQALDEKEKIALNDALVNLEDEEIASLLRSKYGLDDDKIGKILKISLPKGYMSFSRKAIIKLLEFMEQGALTHEAKEVVYRNDKKQKNNGDLLDKLPLPDDLRNPLVNKALFEVRKVINAIIREYGKPAKIKIEMARDVKGSREERKELHFKMRENEKRNEEVRQKLISELNITQPSRDDIIKYKLWEECGRVCPYTGKPISQNALFGQHPEFQVEHILPFSRSLDDGFINKTLCSVDENRRKGNMTPFEFYNGKEQYEKIKQRISVLPYPKRQKFLQKELTLDSCIERELNDTRYICKEVVKYLKQLGVTVKGTKGKVTAELRHQWGLNNILDFNGSGLKNRDDHRHHAVDAAVVAVTENDHLKRLAQSKYSLTDKSFDQPWDGFRDELEKKVNSINVSHRPLKKVSGQLHEETSYGPTGRKDSKGQDIFVYRKKLEDLTCPMIEDIVDPVVRHIVKDRLVEYGVDISKNSKISKEVWDKPLYMKNTKSEKKVQIKKVRITEVANNMIIMKDRDGNPYRAVKPGNNHHIEIYEYQDKKGKIRRGFDVVTMYEAVKRSQNKELVVKTDHGKGCKFICSLAANEMFMLEQDDGKPMLHRVQKISSNGQVYFRPHTYGGELNKQAAVSKVPNQLKGYKVVVDPVGRIYPAND